MNHHKSLLILGFGLWVWTSSSFSAEELSATAITNVTIIDALNGTRENQTVVFKNDSITKIQNASEKIQTLQTIDGDGKFLIPGLWDFHVHLSYEDSLIEKMPALFLSYRITSVRDTGGLLDKLLPIVESMKQPNSVAPRVFYSGPLLDLSLIHI